ncbi:(5-formylfuran-3-yl)methyl phosphate synthase [Planctomicrobium sp. SH661]|uniref:(5-formylfuran-3-yl)methyl phosphate synthase n=1 Tax=Planctomicrobium sp. SH661 TaxID=3448124 RepID=UPI003F5B8539
MTMRPGTPRLLVSVRNAAEALSAVAAGADIIDVKEPQAGSLGKAENKEILQILENVRKRDPLPIVSAAWGEVRDFQVEDLPQEIPPLSYIKLGLAGLKDSRDWKSVWRSTWEQILDRASSAHPLPGRIAVAYADEQPAGSPSVERIIEAAIEQGCAGVLFDTFDKSGGSLLDWISPSKLKSYLNEIQFSGLLTVLAGKVRISDLHSLCQLGGDVIAVRSAACVAGDRTRPVDGSAIEMLLKELQLASQVPASGSVRL